MHVVQVVEESEERTHGNNSNIPHQFPRAGRVARVLQTRNSQTYSRNIHTGSRQPRAK